MQVDGHVDGGERAKRRPVPRSLLAGLSHDAKLPGVRSDPRRWARRQHREVAHQILARWPGLAALALAPEKAWRHDPRHRDLPRASVAPMRECYSSKEGANAGAA